jgi:hypothetical protein
VSPRCPPPQPEFGPGRTAERRVWEVLRDQLPEDAERHPWAAGEHPHLIDSLASHNPRANTVYTAARHFIQDAALTWMPWPDDAPGNRDGSGNGSGGPPPGAVRHGQTP